MGAGLVGNVHLVAGNAQIIPALLAYLEDTGIRTRGNPDIYVRTYQRFGIEEARELRERAALRAVGDQRVFIVVTPGMTTEAQNALLKTLEEPPADAMFFFIIPAPRALLSTLRSRAQILQLLSNSRELEHKGASQVDAKAFLAAVPQKRLDMLKPLLEKDDDDKRDMGAIIAFLSSLERECEKRPEGLESVYRARKYIGDKGALVKPLLEQVALLTPKV